MSLTNYFDKVYCINLDDRKDRWEECVDEFNKIDALNDVERFSKRSYIVGQRFGTFGSG